MNEAILTGEAVPQTKESIISREDTEVLDIKTKHKSHILNGGTEVLQMSPPAELPQGMSKPPVNGAIGYVLKSGFDTK